MNNIYKIRGAIFGSLYPNTIHIHVGYGVGMIDGGGLLMVNRDKVPGDCRMPNTLVWIISKDVAYNVIRIEKMNDIETLDNPYISSWP
ncbi:hypothetical protein MHTCC0001_05880 [Flavobacteriaceae bacterium MHTCC 0001]